MSLTVDDGDDETVAKLEPGRSDGPRLELRSVGTVAELFIGSLDPVELDEASPKDLAEFESLARALVDGDVELVSERTLRGRRPAEVRWPGGRWSLPGNPGVMALFSRSRREKVRGYDQGVPLG
ncbi:hypothetical protein ABZ342_46820 [Amycolatopsis sp. NPDC005961]|uniref:hypothetical protein n=1 Tax=Amycolatopsis sp. NPDC005961 TaxID=3156720 RepID=UPI0033D3F063